MGGAVVTGVADRLQPRELTQILLNASRET
jgi:hypothetical protein